MGYRGTGLHLVLPQGQRVRPETRDIKTREMRKDDLNSLWAFQEKLTKLGHFYTGYDSTDVLLLQFRDQLEKVIEPN
jgi:hypothetical protein